MTVVIPTIPVDDAALLSSNVPDNEFPVYDAGTAYAAGAFVQTTTHRIYKSAFADNQDNDPTDPANVVTKANPAAPWIYVRPTNRWRAFDGGNSSKTVNAGTIEYDLRMRELTQAIAFIGVSGENVRVQVIDGDGVTTYDENKALLDLSYIRDYDQYYSEDEDEFINDWVFAGLSASADDTVRVTIDGLPGGDASVREISYGKRHWIGSTLIGTQPERISYSTTTINEFGDTVFVQRPSVRRISFNVAFQTEDWSRIDRILAPLLNRGAIFYEDEDLKHNLIVSGRYQDLSPPLGAVTTFATITVLGISNVL